MQLHTLQPILRAVREWVSTIFVLVLQATISIILTLKTTQYSAIFAAGNKVLNDLEVSDFF